VTWLIHMCDMTHSYVWHDSFICVTWLIHMKWRVRVCGHVRMRFMILPRVCMCMWDMTQSHAGHDSFEWVTSLSHMRDMTHSYVRHDAFPRVTWLVCMTRFSAQERRNRTPSTTNGEIVPQTPRTEVLRDDSYGYSINNLSKLKLLTFLVEMS